MKKLFIILALLLSLNMSAQGTFTRQGNNFTQVTTKGATAAKETPFTYTTNDNKRYPIFLSKNGRAYINRISRNNKEYKQYLGEEISRQVCREMGVTYVDKK